MCGFENYMQKFYVYIFTINLHHIHTYLFLVWISFSVDALVGWLELVSLEQDWFGTDDDNVDISVTVDEGTTIFEILFSLPKGFHCSSSSCIWRNWWQASKAVENWASSIVVFIGPSIVFLNGLFIGKINLHLNWPSINSTPYKGVKRVLIMFKV